jgi:hypothetical protein
MTAGAQEKFPGIFYDYGGAVFNVQHLDFDATGDGTTDDTAAIVLAVAKINSNGGGTLFFPSGTYIVNFATSGTQLFTFTTGNVKVLLDKGAIIKATADAAPATGAEARTTYVFAAEGQDDITFEGGTYDGNRGAGTDPHAGFFRGIGCTNVTIQNMLFVDCSNSFGGTIRGDSWDGAASTTLTGWKILNNRCIRCAWFVYILNVWNDMQISGNYVRDMDIEDPDAGRTLFGSTSRSRGIRISGYVDATTADGDIYGMVISDNEFYGATYAIEVWNQNAANGQNPDNVYDVVVRGNKVHAVWCIGVNSVSNVTISGNAVRRLNLSTAAMTAYAGTTHITNTSSAFGTGIEARPGYGMVVADNVVTGEYDFSASPDLTASAQGIVIGSPDKDIRSEVTVSNNRVMAWRSGIKIQVCQKSDISNNHVADCRVAVDSDDTDGTNTNGYEDNVLSDNTFHQLAAAAAVALVDLFGSWTIKQNEFSGDSGTPSTARLLHLQKNTASYRILRNSFVYFTSEAILDDALNSWYKGNFYDSMSSSAWGAVVFTRIANKTVFLTEETILRVTNLWSWVGGVPGGGGESYTAGTVTADAALAEQSDSKSGGTIADFPVIIMAPRAAAPGSGYWSAGTRFFYPTPAAAAKIGFVCTTAGTPGTWDDYGVIDA